MTSKLDRSRLNRLYLDHAATSWPKSDAVYQAMDLFARNVGATAGRGAYSSASTAGEIVLTTRRRIVKLINAATPNEISFHASGTLALNAALLGLLRPGDHVVTTKADHNSVLRVLANRSAVHEITWTAVDCDENGFVSSETIMEAVTEQTRLVAVTHASNVTGALLPVSEIGAALRDHPAAFLVDAAQSIGHVPIDVNASKIDLLPAPGHKALGGPFGTAFLYVSQQWHGSVRPTVFGGTGSQSESIEMPADMPGKLEVGNLNIPAIAGLCAAIDESLCGRPAERGQEQSQRIHEGLSSIPGVRVVGTAGPIPVVSFVVDGLPPADCAAILDAEFAIEVRSGLHCAAMIHESLRSTPDGTIRVSCGPDISNDDIDRFLSAMKSICEA